MTQTKADRQEAAKKAAATRERNKIKSESEQRGTKAAATRQGNAAADSLEPGARGGWLCGRQPRRGRPARRHRRRGDRQVGRHEDPLRNLTTRCPPDGFQVRPAGRLRGSAAR